MFAHGEFHSWRIFVRAVERDLGQGATVGNVDGLLSRSRPIAPNMRARIESSSRAGPRVDLSPAHEKISKTRIFSNGSSGHAQVAGRASRRTAKRRLGIAKPPQPKRL
jgi:hypothetical protein